ncbi:hypothetical protein GCM10027399_24870 [Curvibacter fontanus]
MSYDIAKPIVAEGKQGATTHESILERLPTQCSIPGYWPSLAQNTEDWAPVVSASPLWRNANTQLESWQKEYRREIGGTLFVGPSLPPFVGKSEARIKEKTIEKIRRAQNAEDEIRRLFDQQVPVPGLEDLVRARLTVQFLDGVPFLANRLFHLANELGLSPQIEAKGSLNGYFAQHLTFRSQVFFRFGAGAATPCYVTCEVQIATALAKHVWENSHRFYETTRVNLERPEDWQWNPNDPRFLSRQLGHMIHLADGLFCNLRDRSNGK